jgi:hypothetical protein
LGATYLYRRGWCWVMAISRVIPFIATKFRVSPEQIEATRVILHKPPALLAVLKSESYLIDSYR